MNDDELRAALLRGDPATVELVLKMLRDLRAEARSARQAVTLMGRLGA